MESPNASWVEENHPSDQIGAIASVVVSHYLVLSQMIRIHLISSLNSLDGGSGGGCGGSIGDVFAWVSSAFHLASFLHSNLRALDLRLAILDVSRVGWS